jgi:hypothetical protein
MILRSARWLSLAISGLALLPTLVRADADFESVRISLLRDRSGKGGDPKEKYFREFPPLPVARPPPRLGARIADPIADESV